jgi:hypothetical protein
LFVDETEQAAPTTTTPAAASTDSFLNKATIVFSSSWCGSTFNRPGAARRALNLLW